MPQQFNSTERLYFSWALSVFVMGVGKLNTTSALSAGQEGQSTLLAGTTSALSATRRVLTLTDQQGGQLF